MRQTTKNLLMAMLICGTSGMLTAEANAAETQEFLLDELVVTATRLEQKVVDIPANVSLVTSDLIEKRNYQSVSEALEDVPGVIVKRSGFAGGDQHIYLNGDDRVLIMVDGRRLNQDKGTSGRSGFDITNLPSPDFIERIEIVKGAGSSLYGSDAIGGVINIITKSAKSNYVKLNVNGGSWGTENYSVAVSGKNDNTGVFVTASKQRQSYAKYKEADTGNNVKWPNSSSDTTGATIKIDHSFNDDQSATVYFEHNFKEGGKPYYAPGLGGYNQVYTVDNGTDLNNNVSFRYDWGKESGNAGFAQIYRNHYVGNFYRPTGNSYYYETKDGAEVQQSLKLADDNTLIVGAEWRESEVENPGTYGGELAKVNNKALYVQDSWEFAESWQLNTGLRYDKHNYFGNETTFNVAINKKFDENSHAYINWGQVFNAPQTNDLFYYSPSGPTWGGMFGNKNLKPETGDVFTVGYDTKVGEKTYIGVNAFYSKLDDAIKWAAINPNLPASDWLVKNVAEQKKRGMEINFKHELSDEFAINGSYSYVKVEENGNDGKGFVRDANILPNNYKLGISYAANDWNVELYGRGASGAAASRYVDSKYLTLDMSVQYKLNADCKLYAKGYNLTNASYAENGGVSNGKYNFPAAGRSFIVGAEYTF